MSISKRNGAGVIGAIAAGSIDALAISIPPNDTGERRLTVMASCYPSPAAVADMDAIYSRLVVWAGNEPTDTNIVGLDPLSAYFGDGLIPGRPLMDVMVPAVRPHLHEHVFAVEPQEVLWFYLGNARHAVTNAVVASHLSLGVINRDTAGPGTQGYKAV